MTIADVTPIILVGALLALLFEWVPGFRDRWDPLSSMKKQGLMALMLFIVSLGLLWYQCRFNAVCPEVGWQTTIESLVITFFLAAAANQTTHALSRG